MKLLTYLFLFSFTFYFSAAQYDPEALSVLNSMSAKYKEIGSFNAIFTQELVNESADLNEKISGEITVKGGKYVLKVAGQEIYNNGKEVYSYSPELAEVTINTYAPEEQEITLGNIYDLYKEGFKYSLMSVNQAGDRIIELDPISREKSYFKIRMIIDNKDQLKKFTVFERSGNQYIYSIDSFSIKNNLNDSFFTFDSSKYPKVEIIDFR